MYGLGSCAATPDANALSILVCELDTLRTTDRDPLEVMILLLEVMETIRRLPMTSKEFDTSSSHIKNALRFLRSREMGAAHWELTNLVRILTPWIDSDDGF